jgi:hypothetical protein
MSPAGLDGNKAFSSGEIELVETETGAAAEKGQPENPI